jgi:DNA-binding CsgD family transcriptional regulator
MAGPSSPEYGGAGILMTAPMTATERDLRALAGMVSDYRADLPAHGLPMSLLSDLASQIRCDAVLFEGLDSKRQGTWFAESFPADDDAPDDGLTQAHWQHYWDCRPCSHPDRTGDVRSVIKIADFYSAREWHSTGMYCDLYQPQGIEHELMLTLAARPALPRRSLGPGRTLRLFLFRGPGADFSEADRALLTLLRPHLHQAYLDAERRRHPTPRLTHREWDLMKLIAAGHTNTQIARRLGLAEGTVRTHLQNIYGKLQVSSRTAAVNHAFPQVRAVDGG